MSYYSSVQENTGLQMKGDPCRGQQHFWIVFNPRYHQPPKLGFWEEHRAECAAKAMAQKNPGEQFYVLRTTTVSVVNSLQHRRL
jgi:hypothetical protein